jgi:hypothetical protein
MGSVTRSRPMAIGARPAPRRDQQLLGSKLVTSGHDHDLAGVALHARHVNALDDLDAWTWTPPVSPSGPIARS